MPAKPAWYGKLAHLIAELEALPHPWVDRGTVQFLFGVGPRRAQQIMAGCATERIGTSSLADRDLLIAHLRCLGAGNAAHYESRRRRKLAATLEELRRTRLRQPQVLVEAPATIVDQELEHLPEGIRLEPGCITVRFAEPHQALERLLALAMAIGNDPDRFERQVGSARA